MKNPKIKAIVFDFDGVITLEGEAVKEEAWDIISRKLSVGFQDNLKKNIERFADSKGSRYEIIEATLKDAGEDYSGARVGEIADRFNDEVQRLIEESGIHHMTPDALRELGRRFPLYINTATPKKAVVESLKKLSIDHFFTKILGHPESKVQNLKIVAEDVGVRNPREILFVGDGRGDLAAAGEFDCRFVGIPNQYNGWREDTALVLIAKVSDLLQLPLLQ